MKILLIVGNGLIIALVLLCGVIYPSIKEWTHLAAGIFLFHLFLELVIAHLKLLDAAKISAWALQGLSAFGSAGALLPYSLGWGGWWSLLAAAALGFTVLLTVIVALVFKPGGLGDHQPRST